MWKESAQDAKKALGLSSHYEKAHYRLVKALLELENFHEARTVLLIAFKVCGEKKELKVLEDELLMKSNIPLRPKASDFELIDELGDGNFSKVYHAVLKKTGTHYAIKAIEKATADRMKKRHPNITNEILTEKRVLQKLDHPGIVRLFSTFQDYGTLYYHMEFIAGGDLWSRLHDDKQHAKLDGGMTSQVGMHWSLIPFYLAELIDVVEYMHRRGIIHRDLKPENILIDITGHVKVVDFGTAKDLIETDLNGPEFVGTPEYMSPLTIRSKTCGPDSDLWALGIILYQMLLGCTPFHAASPYLIFLRSKKANLMIPEEVPVSAQDMVRRLLCRSSKQRLANATGLSVQDITRIDDPTSRIAGISYDALRRHSLFHTPWYAFSDPTTEDSSPSSSETAPSIQSVYAFVAVTVPSLVDLCIRAVGSATILLAETIANNGGVRPDKIWMKRYDLMRLPHSVRFRIRQYLNRRRRLHSLGVYRFFRPSLADSRCIRTFIGTREYLGLTRDLQGHWNSPFFFLCLSNPLVGFTADHREGKGPSDGWDDEVVSLRKTITSINRLRPRFLVVMGNFVHTPASDPMDPMDKMVDHEKRTESFRSCISRVSESIPVVFIPGAIDTGIRPTAHSLERYRSRFGADYFGFWFGGMRGIVLNSSLMVHPEVSPPTTTIPTTLLGVTSVCVVDQMAVQEAVEQDIWLEEEIEQSKLCSTLMVIFTYHPWHTPSTSSEETTEGGSISKEVTLKWSKKLRHHKVKFFVTSSLHPVHTLRPFRTTTTMEIEKGMGEGSNNSIKDRILRSEEKEYRRSIVRPDFGGTGRIHEEEEEEGEVGLILWDEAYSIESVESLSLDDAKPIKTDREDEEREEGDGEGEEKLPSQMIDEAVKSGELSLEDVNPELVGDTDSLDSGRDAFENEEEDYVGPEMICNPSVTIPLFQYFQYSHNVEGSNLIESIISSSITATRPLITGLRAVFATEESMKHVWFPTDLIPPNTNELMKYS